MRGSLAAVLAVAMLGCGGGGMPTAGSSVVSPGTSMTAPATAALTSTGGPAAISAGQVVHIVDAIDELTLLTDIAGEDLGADFVAWFNTEADWVTAEVDSDLAGDPAIAAYSSAVSSGRQKVIDGTYVMPNGIYEFSDEIKAIVALRERIAAMSDQP